MNTATHLRVRRPLHAVLAVALLALAAGAAQMAQATPHDGAGHGAMAGHAKMDGHADHGATAGDGGHGMMGGHGGHGGQGMMGGGHGRGGAGRMGMLSERALSSVNATPEQRSRIQAIVQAAQDDLAKQRDAQRGLREQAMALFTQPNLDARAAESLRQQMLARHDANSKRMMQAMLEAAAVLTPDQRKQLAERMAQRRGMMERHRAERETLERPSR